MCPQCEIALGRGGLDLRRSAAGDRDTTRSRAAFDTTLAHEADDHAGAGRAFVPDSSRTDGTSYLCDFANRNILAISAFASATHGISCSSDIYPQLRQ